MSDEPNRDTVNTPDFYVSDEKRFSRAFESKEVLSDDKGKSLFLPSCESIFSLFC